MPRNLKQTLGNRLYPAARAMFKEIFGQRNGILIGGAARNIYLPENPRPTKDLDVNAAAAAFKILNQPPKSSYFLFSSDRNLEKFSATYLTNDNKNSVKCDIRLREHIFQETLFRHTELDRDSGIRYPTIQHLIAMKIVSFVDRGEGKKEKDLQDIVDLTEAVFLEEQYEKEINPELVQYYLGGKVLEKFLKTVETQYNPHYRHITQILLPMILGPMRPSPGRAIQKPSASAPLPTSQKAAAVAKPKQEATIVAKSTQAVGKSQKTSSASASASATKPGVSKKVESRSTGQPKGTGSSGR